MKTMGWATRAVAACSVVWWLGLWLVPDLALRVWWGGIVPLLPGLWMLAPRLWRNVCPVAALEIASGTRGGRRLGPNASVKLGALGVVLFVLLVPARPGLFDASGPALATALAVVALLAVARGRTHAVRAGFCNAFCPLGPLERLYGQQPVLNPEPAYCPSCSACTRRGCPDVAGAKALRQLLGRSPARWRWAVRPHGILAASMPGLVVGFSRLGVGPGWAEAYLVTGWAAAASWILVLGVSRVVPDAPRRLPPALAAISGGAFYLLLAPEAVAVWGTPWLPGLVRIIGVGTVLAWALRAAGIRLATRAAATNVAPPHRRSHDVRSSTTRRLPVLVAGGGPRS